MKKRNIFLLALFVGAVYAGWVRISRPLGDQKVTFEPAKKVCYDGVPGASGAVATPEAWKFCVYTAAQGDNGRIAYFLHGRNLDENIWNDDTYYTAMLQKYWAEHQILPPKIVTVSFGPVWLLTPKMTAEKSGLLDRFIGEVLQRVDRETGVPLHRIVFGDSMGGLNSLFLALNTKDVFERAASLCPPIYQETPFAGMSLIKSALKRTGADPLVILGLRSIAMKYFSTEEEWLRVAPLVRVDLVDTASFPRLYLSAALYDKYGSFEGSEAFATKARGRGLDILWHPFYGGHCSIDIESLAVFLAE